MLIFNDRKTYLKGYSSTLQMIFGMCNIWVILRRNVIYIFMVKRSWSTFLLSKIPDMMSLDEFFGTKERKTNLHFIWWHRIWKLWMWKNWAGRGFIIFLLRITQILHIPKTWGNFNRLAGHTLAYWYNLTNCKCLRI